jgi:type III restriction enzyme
MLEPKSTAELQDPEVQTKRDVAVKWCALATQYAASIGGKPWKYALIPHDVITDNRTLKGLMDLYRQYMSSN